MSLFEWDDSYSVGIEKLDDHHLKLISLTNKLYLAMKEGKGKVVMEEILLELLSYVKYHFSTEERMMANVGYQGLIEHKKEHEAFAKKMNDFFNNHQKGSVTLSIEILNFLRDWLVKHIKKTDMLYATTLKKNT